MNHRNKQGYVWEFVNGRKVFAHRVVAERAVGRPLPRTSVVHHVDGNVENNSNNNLVILQNAAEHASLHMRQRAQNAGVDYKTHKWCHACGAWLSKALFSKNRVFRDGLSKCCKKCDNYRKKVRKI